MAFHNYLPFSSVLCFIITVSLYAALVNPICFTPNALVYHLVISFQCIVNGIFCSLSILSKVQLNQKYTFVDDLLFLFSEQAILTFSVFTFYIS